MSCSGRELFLILDLKHVCFSANSALIYRNIIYNHRENSPELIIQAVPIKILPIKKSTGILIYKNINSNMKIKLH